MDIQAWWNTLDTLTRVLYAVAVPATCVLLIQIVLIAIGLGHAGGVDSAHHFGDFGDTHSGMHLHGTDGAHLFGAHMGDTGGGVPHGADAPGHAVGDDGDGAQHPAHEAGMDALRLFTLSGIVSFFTVFGWSSIILYQNALPGVLAVVLGLALGYGAMYGAAKLVQWSIRLQEVGNLVLENAVGQTAWNCRPCWAAIFRTHRRVQMRRANRPKHRLPTVNQRKTGRHRLPPRLRSSQLYSAIPMRPISRSSSGRAPTIDTSTPRAVSCSRSSMSALSALRSAE